MTQELRIVIREDGSAQVVSNMQSVDGALKQVDSTQKSTFASMRDNLAMTGLAISTIERAFQAATRAFTMFTQPASEIEQLKLRLQALYGSAERGAEAFDVFQTAAAKTPATLLEVVNAGAQLKAFGLDAENTISAVSDLAAFMGVNIVEAANSMGRAFAGGAGAADILRERGILNVIKDFNKLDDLTKLTLPEFRAAMLFPPPFH